MSVCFLEKSLRLRELERQRARENALKHALRFLGFVFGYDLVQFGLDGVHVVGVGKELQFIDVFQKPLAKLRPITVAISVIF